MQNKKGYCIAIGTLLIGCFALLAEGHTEINCSPFVYGSYDWGKECVEQVRRVRQFCGGTGINFVVTAHWLSPPKDPRNITGFCFYDGTSCDRATPKAIKEFQDGMGACLREAVRLNFTAISILPHLDHYDQKMWRNSLDMDPFKSYDKTDNSYWSIMLRPLAFALKTISAAKVGVLFSMQGEMGYMVVKYPKAWLQVAQELRKILPRAKIGISFNHSGVCGERCNPNSKNKVDVKSFVALTNNLDFLGVSAYSPMNASLALGEYGNAVASNADELRHIGVNLTQYAARPGKMYIYHEVGVGGAYPKQGVPAKTAQQALEAPYRGVLGPYKKATDPWKPPLMRAFIHRYYRQMVKWIKQGTGPLVKVDYIYTWNLNSWDLTGIHRNETGYEGSYRDYEIIKILKSWNNREVMA